VIVHAVFSGCKQPRASAASNEARASGEGQEKPFDSASIGKIQLGLEPASGMNLLTDMPRLNGLQASTMSIGSEGFGSCTGGIDESTDLANGGSLLCRG